MLPRKIGVVTSLDGAAIRDILSVLAKRYPQAHVVIRPARVQGEGAAQDVARGLQMIARVEGVDVVIVGRGGGSIEDLWAFNEEVVARAIAACPVPVISAVGHETDVTIADFVADLRAPTPSAAAERVVARRDEFVARIDRQGERLGAALDRRLLVLRSRVHALDSSRGLARVPATLALRGRHVGELAQHLRHALADRVRAARAAWSRVERALERHDPRADWPRPPRASRPGARGWTRRSNGAGTRDAGQFGDAGRAARQPEPAGRARPRLRRVLGRHAHARDSRRRRTSPPATPCA